jgi:hypothetical protein
MLSRTDERPYRIFTSLASDQAMLEGHVCLLVRHVRCVLFLLKPIPDNG